MKYCGKVLFKSVRFEFYIIFGILFFWLGRSKAIAGIFFLSMLSIFKDYLLSIHSADSISSSIPWQNYLINDFGYRYNMRSTTRHLLPPPYDTNCHDYDQDLVDTDINQLNISKQFCKTSCTIYKRRS